MSEAHVHFQYDSAAHQEATALDGMWLFLATEVLFFGALFLTWLVSRHFHPQGFAEAARHTELLIGSINTAVLVTSSFVFSCGLGFIERGDARSMIRACFVTALLGLAFITLKGVEWTKDFSDHLVPGPGFAIAGADSGGAQIFFCFYFVATVLHAVHMLVGLGLIAWLVQRARRGAFSAASHAPVEVVGLYWSFVDVVWLVLYPLIYLVGRPG
ncbi:MAG: cytochrome c oxidase subunit 3 [Acidisphaera sp.]|nr:cytochrome c oxidase subunit 3 [Acidisphaera sp.]